MKAAKELIDSLSESRVLFVTTKNLDYIRNSQEISLISQRAASLEVLGDTSNSYSKRLLKVFFKLFFTKTNSYDCVFVGFAPQLIIPFFSFKLRKKRLVIDFFISVYDTLCFDRCKFKPTSLAGRFCRWLDCFTISKADAVICDTQAHGQYFIDEFSAKEDILYRLFLEADTSIYHKDLPYTPYNDGRHHVLYFGSILPLQGVEIILEAISLFLPDEPFAFDIIGPLANQSCPQGAHINYYSWLSQEALAVKIAAADLCLAGHFSGYIMKAKRTIPGKAYIYEAMEKPFILGDGPANHELFTADEKHIFVEMGDAAALAGAIREYFNDKDSTI